MRGVPASALHNYHRHYYISVDTIASNWKPYVLDHINKLQVSGIVHILDCYTHQEIERLMV